MCDLRCPQDERVGQADNERISAVTEPCQDTRVGHISTGKLDIVRDGLPVAERLAPFLDRVQMCVKPMA